MLPRFRQIPRCGRGRSRSGVDETETIGDRKSGSVMAYYLVTAKPISLKMPALRKWLDSGEIRLMTPFGQALHMGLDQARWMAEGLAIWEEEDYCTPPLAQERAAVLDAYFTDLKVEAVEKHSGWKQIEAKPSLWV